MTESSLPSALALAERGMCVFPITPAKTPYKGFAWSERATTDPDVIERNWHEVKQQDRRRRDAPAVGIACEPSGLFVLDIDPDDGGNEWLGRALMKYSDEFTRTVTAVTPSGGQHLYFRAGGLRLKSTVGKRGGAIYPGVDTRARGGFVVAPDSVIKAGAYCWVEGGGPGESPMRAVPEFIAKQVVAPPIPERVSLVHKRGGDTRNTISCVLPPFIGAPTTASLAALDKDDAYVWAQARHIGIPDVPLRRAFLCVIHGDTHPSAALFRLPSGHVRYHDFHLQGSKEERDYALDKADGDVIC